MTNSFPGQHQLCDWQLHRDGPIEQRRLALLKDAVDCAKLDLPAVKPEAPSEPEPSISPRPMVCLRYEEQRELNLFRRTVSQVDKTVLTDLAMQTFGVKVKAKTDFKQVKAFLRSKMTTLGNGRYFAPAVKSFLKHKRYHSQRSGYQGSIPKPPQISNVSKNSQFHFVEFEASNLTLTGPKSAWPIL